MHAVTTQGKEEGRGSPLRLLEYPSDLRGLLLLHLVAFIIGCLGGLGL